jgi:hypothetical protein
MTDTKKPFETLVEEAALTDSPYQPWEVAAAKAFAKLPTGKEMTAAEFSKIVDDVRGITIGHPDQADVKAAAAREEQVKKEADEKAAAELKAAKDRALAEAQALPEALPADVEEVSPKHS